MKNVSSKFDDVPAEYRSTGEKAPQPRLYSERLGFDISHIPIKDEYARDYIGTLVHKKGRAETTVNGYQARLRQVIPFLQEVRNKNVLEAEKEDLEEMIRYHANVRDCRKSTANDYLRTFKYLLKHIQSNCNPPTPLAITPADIEAIDLDEFSFQDELVRTPLDRDEITRMIEVDRGQYPDRNRLIIKLLYKTGIRNQSLRNIKLDDLYLENKKQIFIRVNKKSAGPYWVPVPDDLILDIEYWLNFLREPMLRGRESDYLFPGEQHEKLKTNGALRNIVHEQALAAGVQKQIGTTGAGEHKMRAWRVFPHLFRHCLTTHIKEDMKNDGSCNLSESEIEKLVQILRGDRKITSQETYTHNVNFSQNVDTIRRFQERL